MGREELVDLSLFDSIHVVGGRVGQLCADLGVRGGCVSVCGSEGYMCECV